MGGSTFHEEGEHTFDKMQFLPLTNIESLLYQNTKASSSMCYMSLMYLSELNKSLKVIALLLLIFGPNVIILFDLCQTVNIF